MIECKSMQTIEYGRQQGTHKVLGIRHLTDSAFVLQIEKKNFKFIPGQCVNIGLVNEAINREYSSYSSPNDDKLEFLIKTVEGGAVTPRLSKLKPGNKVSLDGAYGLFTLDEKKLNQKHILIATGTGIAPFHSFVKTYPKLDYQIIHGIRYANEQYDRKDYAKNRYVACVSREKGGDFSGRVTDYLKANKIDKRARYYLCGNSEMINDVYDILSEAGINGSNIVTEVFF